MKRWTASSRLSRTWLVSLGLSSRNFEKRSRTRRLVIDSSGSTADLVVIDYDQSSVTGHLSLDGAANSPIWSRLRTLALEDREGREQPDGQLILPWSTVLGILREYGTKQRQQALGF